ncbi:MAG: hypothetical protein C0601_10190 [Candidatus Muiribacterium halophilum]|uniref:Uncharacterized protein n=1 Tax=Muiribacterium halophilum TaxID=2053465 RepID=A0A2N5ZCP8_MUIH1|nr:MAG: hypothetical protein C0601_10190 [Candidatus Muirbacterium halophilum]
MDAKMKKNIVLGVLALIAVAFLIYNNFIRGKGDDTLPPNPYPVNNAGAPRPGQPASPTTSPTPGQPARRKTGVEQFNGYEEIVKEIYVDYENENIISKDIRNMFKDFKLSPEMHRKAKEAIFTVEGELQNFEALIKSGATLNFAEYIQEAEDYLKLAREALADKNYLKAELFGRKALIEIRKLDLKDMQTSGSEKKGPNVTVYYKGFLIAGNQKIAILKRVVTFTDIVGSENIELLKLKVGDEINLGLGEDYNIIDISRDEIKLQDKRNSRLKRSIPIDKKF